jgi:hypothetical protein
MNRKGSGWGRRFRLPTYSRVEMKYLVIYEQTATGYSAYAPDLPGCIKDGLPVPEPSTVADYITAA